MRLELKSGSVRLAKDQTLKLLDALGTVVCALEGSVWITEENHVRDIVLAPGHCYRLRARGLALINSLGGEAAVALS